jgi:farnesyl-diphosphate farnesyltransferase
MSPAAVATHAAPAEAPRDYCRRVLPRVSRTFAINIELLDDALRDVVRAAYLLCRAADALEDSWPGTPAEISARFAAFLRALDGDADAAAALASGAAARPGSPDDLQLLAHLPLVLAALGERPAPEQAIVRAAVRTMAEGMSRYAARAAGRDAGACYLDDDRELLDYCWVVAGCVGDMLTRLFELRLKGNDPARARRRELAPRVGEALQLTNILLDLPGDVRRGRCYLPAAWLSPLGLTPADLVAAPRPEARVLTLRLESLAHAALDRVADYLETVPRGHLRYRLFCLWPALWARASLRLVHRDHAFPCVRDRARLTRGALWGSAARSLAVIHSHRGVRRLLAER